MIRRGDHSSSGHIFRPTAQRPLHFSAVLIFCAAASGQEKLSPELRKRNASLRTVEVIIQFAAGTWEKHNETIKDPGGSLSKALEAIDGGLHSVPAARLQLLAADPEIAYLSADRPVVASLEYAARRRAD